MHADETPVSQLDPGQGKTRKAYLWVYRSNDLQPGPKIVIFDYQSSRSGECARQFLGAWRGHLMVDDYAGYKALFSGESCIELACLAHARRKFFDLHQEKSLPALASLYDALIQARIKTPQGGAAAKAINYTLKRWPALIRYALSQSTASRLLLKHQILMCHQ